MVIVVFFAILETTLSFGVLRRKIASTPGTAPCPTPLVSRTETPTSSQLEPPFVASGIDEISQITDNDFVRYEFDDQQR